MAYTPEVPVSVSYRFEDCELFPATRALRRAGREVPLQPKVLDLLLLLVRYREQVLSKDDLSAALWPEVRVSEAALKRLVKEARRAVGDDGDAQRVIRTAQRHGYRFVAPVTVQGGALEQRAALGHVEAAEQALARNARAEAEVHYRSAIAMLGEHRSADAALLVDTLLALAETQRHGLSGAVDRAVLLRAAAVARVHGLSEHFGHAVLALCGDAPNWRPDAQLIALLEEGLRMPQQPVLYARLLARLAVEHSPDPLGGEAQRLRDQAIEAARRAGTNGLFAVCASRSDWLWDALPVRERNTLLARVRDEARGRHDAHELAQAELLELRELLARGDDEAFCARAERLEHDLAGRGEHALRYRLTRLRIARDTMRGEFATAEERLLRVAQPPCGFGIAEVWDDQSAQRSMLAAARERMDEIGPVCAPSPGASPVLAARCVQLWMAACSAQEAQARYELRQLLPQGDLRLLGPADAALVAASAALLGAIEPAEALHAALWPLRGRHVLRGELICYGPADYFLGVLSELRGERDQAVRSFRSAEKLAQRSGAVLASIRVRTHLARLCSGKERTRLARAAYQDAEARGLSLAAEAARRLLD